ncbi:MAG: hypothetical protein WCR48_08420 [Bacteroidales bacterium]
MTGEITNASITTTNSLTPAPLTYQVADDKKSLKVVFNEPLMRGKGKAYVTYYPVNKLADSIKTNLIEIPDKNIIIDGKNVTFVPTMEPGGAYVNIIWENDFLRNSVGTPLREFKKKGFNESDPDQSAGIIYRLPLVKFNIYAMVLNQSTNKYEKMKTDYLKYFENSEDCVLHIVGDSTIVQVATGFSSYLTFKGKGRSLKIELSLVDATLKNDMMSVSLPEECPKGYTVDYSLGLGMVEDKYGNKGAELSSNDHFIRTRGLTTDDIIGIYSATATSYWGGQMTETGISIQKHPSSKDSVIIKNLASTNQAYIDFVKKNSYIMANYEIPAFFNGNTGDLRMGAGYGIANAKTSSGATPIYVILANSDEKINTIEFDVTAPGEISFAKNKGMMGYLLYNASTEVSLGYLDLYTTMKWTLTSKQQSGSTPARPLIVNGAAKGDTTERIR